MLSMNAIARVTVTLRRASASPSAFDTPLILAPDPAFTEERRLWSFSDVTAAAETLRTLGFSVSSLPYKAALKCLSADPAPARLLFSCYPSSESPSEALTAVLERTAAFYGVFVADDLTDAAVLALDETIRGLEIPLMLFLPLTGAPEDVCAGGALLPQLYALQTRRVLPCYVETPSDAACVLGTAMGLQLSHPASSFTLCYKTLTGVQPSALTQTQVDRIQGLNGNVYVERGPGRLLFEKGSTASGLRYDEVLYTDMIAEELRQEGIAMLTESPDRLPQTDDSTARFLNRFAAILSRWTDRGVLATAPWSLNDIGPLRHGDVLEGGFTLWADSYDTQSEADRAAHKAMPVQVALHLAGSIESLLIAVQVAL